MRLLEHKGRATWRSKLRRLASALMEDVRHGVSWLVPRRPAFLTFQGHGIRLRWILCAAAIWSIEPRIKPMLDEGRKIMFHNHEGGRSSPEWMRGKQLAEHARYLEDWLRWLAEYAGPQYTDGSSHVNLMDIVRIVR